MQLNVHWLQQHPDGGMVTAREEEANINEGSLAYHLLVQLRSGQVPVYSKSEDSSPWELVEETAVLSPDLQYGVTLLADPKPVLKTPSQRNGHQSLHYKTPSDNKRLKMEQGQMEQATAPSPGKVLDDCQGENVLEVAMKAYSPTLDKMAPPQGLFAPTDKELLRFAKKELPFTGPRIDMRFTNGGYLPVTPMGQALIENFERHRNSIVLFGKSGCGKTTAIFDAAQRYPCLLFTASSEKADKQKRADPGAKDRSFEALVADVTGLLDDPNVTNSQKEHETEKLILALLVARLLMLLKFRQMYQDDTAKLWLMYQLTDQMHSITKKLYYSLKMRRLNTLLSLENDIALATADYFYFYAFDEAQYGYTLLQEKQTIWKSTQNGAARGIACPFLRKISSRENKPVIVAGTAMTLGSVDSCKSDVGKTQQCTDWTEFPHVSLDEIKARLEDWLNVGDVDLDKVRGLWKLEGRGRLLGGLIATLGATVNGGGRNKKQVLESAITAHFQAMTTGLVGRLKESLRKYTVEDPITRKRNLPKGIELLAIASLLGGTVSLAEEDTNIDLIHDGICSVRKVGNKNTYLLDEELGRQAILDLAHDNDFFCNKFEEVCKLCKTAGGHAMEPLLAAELRYWCTQQKDPTVQTFLEALFSKEEFKRQLKKKQKSWAKEAKFNIKGAFTRDCFVGKSIRNDVDFVGKAVSDQSLQNLLLSPSTVKRPDFEAVMSGNSLWFLSASSKLYSYTYDDTDESDLRSTAPQMFYMKKNGEENGKCKLLHAAWTTLRSENSSLFSNCLRIHFCLPDVKRLDDNPDRLFVDSDGSVVAYITFDNIGKIFRRHTVDILKGLKGV